MTKRWVVLLALSGLAGCGINMEPGGGEKIGQIVKVSKVGLVCKTYEAQLIRGGMSGGSGTIGTVPFDFTIEDGAMADAAFAAMQAQEEVIVSYETEGVYRACRSGSSGHFAISIEPALAR